VLDGTKFVHLESYRDYNACLIDGVCSTILDNVDTDYVCE